MTDDFIKQLEKEIPALNDDIRIEKLTRGFSEEKKYIIYYPDSSRGLLRITKIEGYNGKKWQVLTFDRPSSQMAEPYSKHIRKM